MKPNYNYGIYDFSDYAEEITGDDLFKINGGATSCSNVAPSGPSGGSGGNTNQGTVKPATTGNGQGGDSGTGTSPTGGSSTPTQGSGGPTGPSGPSAPDISKSSEYQGVPTQYRAILAEQKAKREQKKETTVIMGENIYSEYFINKYYPEQYRAAALEALILEEKQGKYGSPTDSKRVIIGIGEKTELQENHTGVDIGGLKAGVKGDPIYATADGVVLRNGITDSRSTRLELSLPYCNDTAIYQHGNFIVHEGENVKRGQIIGYMSDNGTFGQVHLHYEIRDNGLYAGPGGTGKLLDPLIRMPACYTKE